MNDNYNEINGIFQGDLIIKTCIELAIEDMKKNPYIIDDVFSSLITNPILNKKYGVKELNNARNFILNNKIHYFMGGRMDKEEFPCVTISVGPSNEDESLATLGDLSHCVEELSPKEAGRKISYIVAPFLPKSYDKLTGGIEVDVGEVDISNVRENMFVLNTSTGEAFPIKDKEADNTYLYIEEGQKIGNCKLAIIPEYQIYRARRERAISQEQYNIGCHAHGDANYVIFLYSVVKYGLFRYREGLLENNNFQLSTLRSMDLIKNPHFEQDNVYSRFISISGQVEESWLKAPKRVIEIMNAPSSYNEEDGSGGLKILSKEAPESIELEDEGWITIDEE